MGRQYVRQSFSSASCAAGDSSCAVNTTLQCVVVNATGQSGPPRVVREVTSSSAGTPPSMEKVAQGQACATPQNNTIRSSSGNKLYALYETKVFRPTSPIL